MELLSKQFSLQLSPVVGQSLIVFTSPLILHCKSLLVQTPEAHLPVLFNVLSTPDGSLHSMPLGCCETNSHFSLMPLQN
jgi:hypothetical protein